MLGNVGIRRAVDEAREARLKRVDHTADEVVREIGRVAFADIREAYDDNSRLLAVKEFPDDVAASVASIRTTKQNLTVGDGKQEDVIELKRWDKLKALDMLAKHHNLYEKHQEAAAPKVEIMWKDSE